MKFGTNCVGLASIVLLLSACELQVELPESGLDYGIEAGASVGQYNGESPSFDRFLSFGLSEIELPNEDPFFGQTAVALVESHGQKICGISLNGPKETRQFTAVDKENQIRAAERAIPELGRLVRDDVINGNFDYKAEEVTKELERLNSLLKNRFGKSDGKTHSDDLLWFSPEEGVYSLEVGRQNAETYDALSMTIVFDKACTNYRPEGDAELVEQEKRDEAMRIEQMKNSPMCDLLRKTAGVDLPPHCQ